MQESTSLYYMRARYYDATVGRFISEDPSGFDGGDVNLYAYCGDNPINRVDPSGLFGNDSIYAPAWTTIGKITLTGLGDLRAEIYPIARASARVGGAVLTGITLGTDVAQFYAPKTLSMRFHDAALVISDVVSMSAPFLPPTAKPLRWTGTVAHVWDKFTQEYSDRIYGNE